MNRQARKSMTGIRSTAFFTTMKVEPQMAVTTTRAVVAAAAGDRWCHAVNAAERSSVAQRPERREVALVRLDVARCLDDDRHVAGRRMPEQLRERLDADQAGADVGVAVTTGSERVLGVVGVD